MVRENKSIIRHMAGGKTLFVLLLALLNTIIMAQTEYKTAKEARGIEVGQIAPDFEAKDTYGSMFRLYDALKKGPVVMVFYRGHWCPVCNKHLSNLQDSLYSIEKYGATLVAISPEKPELSVKTQQKTNTSFSLLHDDGYVVSNLYDVSFKPGSATALLYNVVLGARLSDAHSDNSERLPIPATYIIGTDGKILWRHFDPDYKKRSTAAEILKNLPYPADRDQNGK